MSKLFPCYNTFNSAALSSVPSDVLPAPSAYPASHRQLAIPLHCYISGKRNQGRQPKKWMDHVNEDVEANKLTVQQAMVLMWDRNKWQHQAAASSSLKWWKRAEERWPYHFTDSVYSAVGLCSSCSWQLVRQSGTLTPCVLLSLCPCDPASECQRTVAVSTSNSACSPLEVLTLMRYIHCVSKKLHLFIVVISLSDFIRFC